MTQEDYTNIPVTKDAKAELNKRKMNKQARVGKPVSWDKFLLEATKGYV